MPPRTCAGWAHVRPVEEAYGPSKEVMDRQGQFAADNRPESGLPPSPSPAPAREDEQESPHGSVGEIAQDQTSHQKRLDVDDAQILRRLKVGEQGHSGEDDGSEDALHRGTLHATILAHDPCTQGRRQPSSRCRWDRPMRPGNPGGHVPSGCSRARPAHAARETPSSAPQNFSVRGVSLTQIRHA